MIAIDLIKEDLQVLENDPLRRLAMIIKAALKHFQPCREHFLSNNEQIKKQAAEAGFFLLNSIEEAVSHAQLKLHMNVNELMYQIYQNNMLTPLECQLYLQAQAWILQNREDLLEYYKPTHEKMQQNKLIKKRKNKLSKIRI